MAQAVGHGSRQDITNTGNFKAPHFIAKASSELGTGFPGEASNSETVASNFVGAEFSCFATQPYICEHEFRREMS